MALRPWNGLSLAAGIGGIDLGLKLALGDRYRCVGACELDAEAAAILARRQTTTGDRYPIWDDITTFDGSPWRRGVDIISAGLPCQPYSLAGSRKGHSDERALWPDFIRIVRECDSASIVFIENVPPFLKHFQPIYDELRAMGFVLPPPAIVTAHEVGAPHWRPRLFVLAAHPDRWGRENEWSGRVLHGEREAFWHDANRCDPGTSTETTWEESQSPALSLADGPPDRVAQLRQAGNAVVPLVAALEFCNLIQAAREMMEANHAL